MCGYDGDLVGIAEGKVGVDKDEDVGDCLSEGEAGVEGGPGTWVGVDDDGEEGGRAVDGGDLVVLRDVDGIHVGRRWFVFWVGGWMDGWSGRRLAETATRSESRRGGEKSELFRRGCSSCAMRCRVSEIWCCQVRPRREKCCAIKQPQLNRHNQNKTSRHVQDYVVPSNSYDSVD